MKKALTFLTIFTAVMLIYGSSARTAVQSEGIIEIKEKFFITQTNEIYLNAEEYIGKTIKYEGLFGTYEQPNGEKRYFVIRYGPGCCSFDSNAGFEVYWNNQYPAPNDWVEAVGVLEEYEDEGIKYLRLALNSLTVMQTRGKETVLR